MNSEKNDVDKIVEHLIRQEIKHLKRQPKEQANAANTTKEVPLKDDKPDSEQR
jgi:hypothetical protein